MKPYTFCALVANYNDAPTLEEALTPLMEQTVPFDRILVVNDGSTDDSLKVLERLRVRAPRLEILDNGRNLGVMASVNIGFKHATEDYVFPASANDIFSSRLVEYAQQALAVMPDAGMVAGKLCRMYTQSGNQQIADLPFSDGRISLCNPKHFRALVKTRHFSPWGGATFVHRVRALELGGFREEMKWMSDWFLFALLANRYGFAYVPEIFGTMMMNHGQYSQAIYDWRRQGPVIHDFFRVMQQEFPQDLVEFRTIGLLPSYDWQTLPMLIRDRQLRSYLTPLLLWRLGFYKPGRALARRLLPRHAFDMLRRFVRL